MKYQLQNNRLDIFIDARFLRKPLSSFFEEYCISKSTRYRYMMENRILIQNTPVRQDTRVFQKEDVLTILLPEEDIDWSPSDTPCTVLYENTFVFVVHKEAGIPIHTEKQDTTVLMRRWPDGQWIKDTIFPYDLYTDWMWIRPGFFCTVRYLSFSHGWISSLLQKRYPESILPSPVVPL